MFASRIAIAPGGACVPIATATDVVVSLWFQPAAVRVFSRKVNASGKPPFGCYFLRGRQAGVHRHENSRSRDQAALDRRESNDMPP